MQWTSSTASSSSHPFLASRRTPISLEQLMAKLECSKSTVLRAIETMKNHLRAPICSTAKPVATSTQARRRSVRAAGPVVHGRR